MTRPVEPLVVDASEIDHAGFIQCTNCPNPSPAVGVDTEYDEGYCFAHYLQQQEGSEPLGNEFRWLVAPAGDNVPEDNGVASVGVGNGIDDD